MRANACKEAHHCCILHRSKTAEARRKPVLIDRFNLTHPAPAKPSPLSAMTEHLYAVGVVPASIGGVSPRKRAVRAAYERV